MDIAPLAPEDLRRAAQLTLRTNQFNFTTSRREEAELQVTGLPMGRMRSGPSECAIGSAITVSSAC